MPTVEQSNAVIDDALKTTLGSLLAAALAGGAVKTVGFAARPSSTKKIISGPAEIGASLAAPNVVSLPYPDEEEEEKKAGSKPGLWDRIHAKRKRGEKPAKPGDEDYPDAKSWKATTKESSSKDPQPGTDEFNAALHKHLYGKKKNKDPQPGTEEFNQALHKHLYGKEMPKKTNESEKKAGEEGSLAELLGLGRPTGVSPEPPITTKGFLAGQSANSIWSVPWFWPALAIGGPAAFMGGSALAEKLLKKNRKEQIKSEVDKAKEEFESALEGSYDPKVLGLHKTAMLKEINDGLEKLASHLKVAQPALPSSAASAIANAKPPGLLEELGQGIKNYATDTYNTLNQGSKDAYRAANEALAGPGYDFTSQLGGFGLGLASVPLLMTPLLAGYLAYKHYDRQNPTKLLQEKIREKQYDRLQRNIPEVFVELDKDKKKEED